MSVEAPAAPIGRLVRSVDFERVLRNRSRAQSVHFALHHLADRPRAARRPDCRPVTDKLSTGRSTDLSPAVDDFPFEGAVEPLASPSVGALGLWFGAVVPKRHARRAVTRTLLKRQIRAAMTAHVADLPNGLWVVRLRAPFDRVAFPSAASPALQRAARDELEALLARTAASPGASN